MEQVSAKPSWRSRVANVHLTKHTIASVYMNVCVSIQLVSHRPNLHPTDNRWMEIESWYYADRQNTSDRNQFHRHYRQHIAHEPPLEQIHISKVKNE